MAALNYSVSTGEGSWSSTAKTAFTLTAPTNQRVVFQGFELLGKAAAGGTDTPLKIEVMTYTSISGGTAGSVTTAKGDTDMGETVQATIAGNYTVEPTYTGGVTVRTYEINPQTGGAFYWPEKLQMKIKGGTGVAIRITASAAETAVLNAYFEE